MKTKLFTFLFAILAGIGTMSAEIYSGTCGDNISWLLNTTDSTLAITGSGEMDTYNNPAPWRLYSSYIKIVSLSDGITNIGYEAFASCSNLTTVNFPNSITVIGSYAFSRCSSLTSIDIPNTVTIIGGYAFMYCTNLATVSIPNSVTTIQNYAFYECWGLKSVIIPDKVTCIDQSTFFGCKNLSTAVIGNSVTEIKSAAFKNCQELTSIIIPNSVRRIEGNAFVNCSKMTSINIGDKVEYIGDGAFANCDSLKSIVVSNSNRTYDSRNNCNAIIEKSTNILVKGCMNTSIPNTVDSIGYQAFMNCKGLYSINIPDNVKCIGNSAFGGCTELKSVSFGSQLTDIRHRAFANCPQLTSITLPNGIKNIDSYVFSGCSGLSSITIPNSVLSIGGGAFEKCTSLTSFTIPNKISSIEYGVFSGCTRLTSIEIPTNITSIGERAFNGCSGLTSLTIPTSVTSIGDAAFWSCTGLTSVEIPNTVKTLGCFPYCSNLTSVIIPEGVTRLTSNAFYGCSRLTSVTIPKSVNSISEYAFEGCAGNGSLSVYISDLTAWFSIDFSGSMVTGETKLYLNGEEVKYVVTPYNITKINNYTFNKNKTFVSVHIHNDVDTIGARAFGDNTLKSVEIGSGMKYIGEGAFYRCPLTEIKCAALTPPILGYNTFYNVNKSIPLYVPEESIELYKEASGWKEFTNIQALIDGWQMCGDSLMWKINKFDLTIKGKGEMWNYEQFKAPWGKYIETVTIEEGVTSIGDNAFYCPDLTSISIPNSVSKIGGASFEFCRNLHFIQFGKGLIEIGWNAFYGCSSIDSVVLPDKLQIIKSAAFYDCPLTSITIPRNVTEIDDAAFDSDTFTAFDVVEENTTFTSIDGVLYNKEETKLLQYPKGKQGAFTIPYGIKSLEERAFNECNGLTSIVIPNSVSEIGSSAFLGCSELSSVKISDSLINVGWNLFSGCKKLPIIDNIRMADTYIVEVTDMTLSSYTIPAATKWIHYDVFIECNDLDTLTCLAIIPPKAEFPDRIYNSVPLYVPAESIEAYRTKDGWKEFTNILPILPPCDKVASRDTIYAEICEGDVYDFHGMRLSEKGIYRDTLVDPHGCDSIVELFLTVHQIYGGGYPSDIIDTIQITYGEAVIFGEGLSWQHSVVPTENGIYNDTLRTIHGCDSIVSHYIEVSGKPDQPEEPSVLPTHAIDLDLTQSTSIMEWTIIDATLNGTASDISNGKYAYDIKANIPGIAYVTKEPNVQFITQNSNDKQKVIYIQSGQYLMFGGKRGVIKIMNTIAGDKILLTVASKGSTSASFLDDYGEYPKNAAAVSADLTLPAKDNTSVEADANGYIWKELEFVSMGGDVEIKEFAAGFCVKKVVVDSKYKYRQIGDLYYCLVDEYNYAVVIENPKAKYSGDIVIPDSISVEGKQYNVQFIEYFAFADCTELASITSKSTTPPSYQHNTFQGVDSMLPIYVPKESVETYRNAWSRFKNINPLEAEEEVTVAEPTAEPTGNSVVIEWPKDEDAETYTIVIKKGDETICTLTFNAQGQLVTISYAAPSRNGKTRHAQEAVQTTTGWQYTINGLDANTEYTYVVTAKKSDNSVVYEKSVSFKTKDSATEIEDVQRDNVQGTKVLRDGQMYILRGDKMYTLQGQEVR